MPLMFTCCYILRTVDGVLWLPLYFVSYGRTARTGLGMHCNVLHGNVCGISHSMVFSGQEFV